MTNSNQKQRFQTKIAMLEQNNQVLRNKCEEYLGELADTKKKLDIAIDALKVYSSKSGNWWYGYEFQGHYEDYAGEYADKALEQIIAQPKGITMSKKLKIHGGNIPGEAFEVKLEYPKQKGCKMSDIKCPYCNKPLHCGATLKSDEYLVDLYQCDNPECESTEFLVGCKEFWDILGQLIRTRKALEKAKWWLKEIVESHRCTPISTAEMALKEIKALEQKDK